MPLPDEKSYTVASVYGSSRSHAMDDSACTVACAEPFNFVRSKLVPRCAETERCGQGECSDEDLRNCPQCPKQSGDFKKLVLQDLSKTLEDVRRQFKDHNELFTKQASLARTLIEKLTESRRDLMRDFSMRDSINPWHRDSMCHPVNTCNRFSAGRTAASVSFCPDEDVEMISNLGYDNERSSVIEPLRWSMREGGPEHRISIPARTPAIDVTDEAIKEGDEGGEANGGNGMSTGDLSKKKLAFVTSGDQLEEGAKKTQENFLASSGTLSFANTSSADLYEEAVGNGIIFDGGDLSKPEYRVEDLYHDAGVAQAIARSELFANITLAVIGANAIYIGVDADHNRAPTLVEADVGFQLAEYSFFAFFSFEWIVRFCAFKAKVDCFRDMWFKFDSCLVLLMVAETILMPLVFKGGGIPVPTNLIKLVRLLRVARMARLMRALPELVAMIKGVRVASRAVGSALLMLFILVYIFAIIVFVLVEEKRSEHDVTEERFKTLCHTMWTLLVDGAFMEGYGLVSRALLEVDAYVSFSVLLVYVLMSALTVMNMLIGVLCEVVTGVAASEKENADIRLVKNTLLVMLMNMDANCNGLISKDEIEHVFHDEEALAVLKSLQVEPAHLIDHLDMFFEATPDGDLTIQCIMDLILTLRGDRSPTMKDMLHGQNFNRWKLQAELKEQEQRIIDRLKNMQEGIGTELTRMKTAANFGGKGFGRRGLFDRSSR